MSKHAKLAKVKIWKLIQLGWFLPLVLGKKAGLVMKITVPLAKNILLTLGLF